MSSSSSEAAAKTELMASASIQTANGSNLQENGRSRASSQSMQKLKSHVDQMASKYEALDRRLDSLETTLLTLLRNVKERVRNPAAGAGVGPAGEGVSTIAAGVPAGAMSPSDVPDYEFDEDEEDEGGIFDLKKLQANLSENINKGYMESVKHLRDMLMAYEWDLHGKELAGRRGVAKFEQYCAEHDVPEVSFEVLSKLYEDPNNLDALPTDKLKLLARAIIQQTMDERYCSIYYECSTTAKELAHTGLKDIIPDSAGKVGGVLKDILPLPGFIKK